MVVSDLFPIKLQRRIQLHHLELPFNESFGANSFPVPPQHTKMLLDSYDICRCGLHRVRVALMLSGRRLPQVASPGVLEDQLQSSEPPHVRRSWALKIILLLMEHRPLPKPQHNPAA
jgi:hypothetical protein